MLGQGRVRGPVRDVRTGNVVLEDLTSTSELILDYANFTLPPKREFFPQCEGIARYDAGAFREETTSDERVILFGIRPCDVHSLRYLDKVFVDSQFTDPYYRKRRDQALVISLACEKPGAACFCSSVGGGPAAIVEGADVMAFHLGDSLMFEAFSEKGEDFLKKNGALLRDPTAAELQKRKQQEGLRTMSSEPRMDNVSQAIGKHFNSPLWDAVAETCLGCGVCTYLCPTCHCFDLYDEKHETGDTKIRVHDSCMFASFTREASGHNPRLKRGERMRQRVMHKFVHAPENFGAVFCVGCGRCVMHCPTNIDIRETVSRAAP